MPLPEVQRRLRDAIVGGDAAPAVALLVGGTDPGARLAIHRRHYETSLVRAILTKFPATAWLLGSALVQNAATDFVIRHPPTAPCIAEYGADFPGFLAKHEDTRDVAYLRCFAELEWHLGQAAIAVDQPAIGLGQLAEHLDRLGELELIVQPGLRYLASPWPVDELMQLYLTDSAPERYQLTAADIWLEIGGSRGAFRFDRLDRGDFAFRQAIAGGGSLGAAAEFALAADEQFDIGGALRRFVSIGLVIGIRS